MCFLGVYVLNHKYIQLIFLIKFLQLWKRNRCNKRATSIDEITKVAESMASGKSIKEFCKDSKAVNQYENLANEVLAMIS